MGTVAEKLSYLADTKDLFKDRLNSLGAEIIESTTFRNYLTWLDTFYGEVSDKTDLSINGVVGRTSQDGDPTPENPVEIKNLSGDVEYKVRGQGISEIFPLSLKSKNLFDKSLITSIGDTIKYIPINVKKNTDYTLSTNSGTPTSANVFLSTTNSGVTTNNNGAMIDQPRTINSADNNIMYVGYRNDLSPYWVQLEENSIPTDHEPYYDIELCEIGSYKDKIYPQNEKFYLHKEIEKISGTVNWVVTSIASNNRAVIPLARIGYPSVIGGYYVEQCLSNYFQKTSQYEQSSSTEINTISANSENIYIKFDSSINTTSLAKTKLDSMTDLIIYYPPVTPTTTEITEENYPTLYGQLKDIQDYLIKYKINNEFLLDYSSPEIEY